MIQSVMNIQTAYAKALLVDERSRVPPPPDGESPPGQSAYESL